MGSDETAEQVYRAIFKVSAGRVLDAAIAEEVMGIEVEWYEHQNGALRLTRKGYATSPWVAASLAADVPNYSINIAAAWEVVEHLCKDGKLSFRLHRENDDQMRLRYREDETFRWIATFGDWVMSGETAPLAICRAALLERMEKTTAT